LPNKPEESHRLRDTERHRDRPLRTSPPWSGARRAAPGMRLESKRTVGGCHQEVRAVEDDPDHCDDANHAVARWIDECQVVKDQHDERDTGADCKFLDETTAPSGDAHVEGSTRWKHQDLSESLFDCRLQGFNACRFEEDRDSVPPQSVEGRMVPHPSQDDHRENIFRAKVDKVRSIHSLELSLPERTAVLEGFLTGCQRQPVFSRPYAGLRDQPEAPSVEFLYSRRPGVPEPSLRPRARRRGSASCDLPLSSLGKRCRRGSLPCPTWSIPPSCPPPA
jgi:hypothetical protein